MANLTKVGIPDTPEQREALVSLETLMALVEGWVDCVTWRAGMAHIPHIEQLREMMRRKRAVGGPAERTFESLLGMQLRPKRMREAAALWEQITAGARCRRARRRLVAIPDLPPALPDEAKTVDSGAAGDTASGVNAPAPGRMTELPSQVTRRTAQRTPRTEPRAQSDGGAIDWDAELSKLLDEDGGENDENDSAK